MAEITKEQRLRPGVEGCAWRLAAHWDPAKVHDWLTFEIMAQTKGDVAAKALADVMAAAAVGFVRSTTDVRAAATDADGILNLFGAAFRARLGETERTKGGVFLPRGGW